jgi:MFS family permease
MQTVTSVTKEETSALSNPNLRLYYSGQIVSMIGTWMQQMALSWLVYRLTNSAFMLGVIGFATMAPSFLLSPVAGLIADYSKSRHRLVILTQCLAMLQAGALAAVVLTGHVQIWHLVVLGVFMGIINAFDMPTRQTFLIDMLRSPAELPNAIAINSSIFTLTRLIGPAVAGFCIATLGEGPCFLINAVSYIAVIIALLFIRPRQAERKKSENTFFEDFKAGFVYAFGFRPIRALIVLMALVSLFGMPYAVLLPAFAKDVFHGNATTLGWLTAASGVGSLMGALYLASRKGVVGLGRWVLISCTIFGAGLVLFGLSHSFYLSLFLLVFVGFGGMVQMAASNTMLQSIVEEDKRGRVMSIFTMAFMGLAPFGAMIAGALATHIGTGYTVMCSGIACLLLAAGFGSRIKQLRQETRKVYLERGIIAAEAELKPTNQ